MFATVPIQYAILVLYYIAVFACNNGGSGGNGDTPQAPAVTTVTSYVTSADHTLLLAKQPALIFGTGVAGDPTITVDTTQTFQQMDGFGFTLTGGSADVIHRLAPARQEALLHELFSTDGDGIGISFLRISIGASDLDSTAFTLDDMPSGQTDTTLAHFSIAPEEVALIPVLKQILAINPGIQILATPWTAPPWMKTNNSTVGGNLNHRYDDVYANYFVRFIQSMQAEGIVINAITPQNEPLNPGNNPSMVLPAAEEAGFIKNHLGPAFRQAGLSTRIIIFDHNCGDPSYPLSILADTAVLPYIDGTAFHLYSGDISALSQIHQAAPQKNVYFTEQWVGAPGNFSTDFDWGIQNLVIGASNNWARCVLQWNLANDPTYGPHTPGGCTSCLGAVTIGNVVIRNTAYYTIAQASRFVRPGSVRVASSVAAGLANVAFVTPDGKKVLIVLNNSGARQTFNISFRGKQVSASLTPGAAATYTW